MTRRTILTAAELTMSAAALASAVAVLAQAAYQPGSVQWTPVATVGALTALSFVGFAAGLFAGRLGLLLAADTFRAIQLWRLARQTEQQLVQVATGHHRAAPTADGRIANAWQHRFSVEVMEAARGASAAAELPPTLRYTAEELAAAGKPVGGGR